jgi:hypothetical protein
MIACEALIHFPIPGLRLLDFCRHFVNAHHAVCSSSPAASDEPWETIEGVGWIASDCIECLAVQLCSCYTHPKLAFIRELLFLRKGRDELWHLIYGMGECLLRIMPSCVVVMRQSFWLLCIPSCAYSCAEHSAATHDSSQRIQ